MLNRKIPPQIREVSGLTLPEPKIVHLDNGIPVYILDFPGQEIVKLEVSFRAGRPEEHKRLVARTTSQIMREGSQTRSAAEIAELVDFYGGSISIPTNLDSANFVLYSLNKYFHELLPVFAEVILAPSFPQQELETFKRTSIQELQVDLEKVEVVAYRKVTELIFGENHPYGYNSTPEDYEALSIDDLRLHYERWFTPNNCQIFASGGVDEKILKNLNVQFGQNSTKGQTPDYQWKTTDEKPYKLHIDNKNSMQTAIKIGRRLFNKKHADYNGMFVLNTILGGYFGSRLMMNIREKKGFTYNIYSTVDAMMHDGCFYIATEVHKDSAKAAQKEIMREVKKLCDKPVPEQELAMVRNYLLGMLLNGIDGTLNLSEIVKGMVSEEIPLSNFESLAHTIRTITAEELQALAQKYFHPDGFWEVQVG